MKKIDSINEIQKLQYDMMVVIDRIFKEHGLRYILAGGSMLGAVRHNGFIPWDDDIDILVPRDDYDKLREIMCKEEAMTECYTFKFPGDKNYPYPFIKMIDTRTIVKDEKISDKFSLSIWVDIFPLDHMPDNENIHKYTYNRMKFLRTCLESGLKKDGLTSGGVFVQSVFRMLNVILGGTEKIAVRMDKLGSKYNRMFSNSRHFGDGTWPEGLKDYFDESMISPIIRHRFEDSSFCIPKNFDGYLKHFYGNYMTLPPEYQRQRHFIEAYWRDESTDK